jgi:light-regulated signal transduction histidine kinase (bacteriophytochrome)
MKLRLLHLEDNGDDVELVRRTLARAGVDCDILAVDSGPAYRAALEGFRFDAVLSDGSVPGYDGSEALSYARERFPDIPFIVVSGNPELAYEAESSAGSAVTACITKSELHRLGPAIKHAVAQTDTQSAAQPDARQRVATAALVADLERKVAQRTAEVERRDAEIEMLNQELETFSYSVAHDLRSPLITIDGFAQVLLENIADTLDEANRSHLERISTAVRRMHRLINDLLELSKIVRAPIHSETVDLSWLARQILQKLHEGAPERVAEFVVADGIVAEGDPTLLRIALEHLLSNAWKFTATQERTRIEFGSDCGRAAGPACHVRDNGVGFDPRHAAKLFSPFQRLHPKTQFAGDGIGLAIVRRIIHRHGGEVWAESAVDCGAAFYFTLPR